MKLGRRFFHSRRSKRSSEDSVSTHLGSGFMPTWQLKFSDSAGSSKSVASFIGRSWRNNIYTAASKSPEDAALILQYSWRDHLHRNAPTIGHPPRPPLRPLRHPPINLHSRISSSCNSTLWTRPRSFRQRLPALSCTLHHDIRRPQFCHWTVYGGVLLAGDV